MDPGAFRGEEDIDKTKIIISDHALQRFSEHLKDHLKTEQTKNLTKNQKKEFREKFGFSIEVMPDNSEQVKTLLRKLLHYSTHKNTSWKGERMQSYFKYREETFFLRNRGWQFRLIQSKENPDVFILKTAIWLNDFKYSLCFKK